MPISLTIADNADGTGVVATIAGSVGGRTNAIWRAAFDSPMAGIVWTDTGASRVGDGTVAVTSAVGYYLWQVRSMSAGLLAETAESYQNATDAGQRSVLDRVLDAVVARVQSLNLTGPNEVGTTVALPITREWFPRVLKGVTPSLPCIAVAPINGETWPGYLTGRDDVGYLIGIALVDRQNASYTAGQTLRMLWREKVRKAFISQRLSGVPESLMNKMEDGQIADPEQFVANYLVSWMTVRVITRESRGL